MLKNCPFCGSAGRNYGGVVDDVRVDAVHCSNRECLASFKSVDAEVWNARVMPTFDMTRFELLMRRFCMASPGAPREAARSAVLAFVMEVL